MSKLQELGISQGMIGDLRTCDLGELAEMIVVVVGGEIIVVKDRRGVFPAVVGGEELLRRLDRNAAL